MHLYHLFRHLAYEGPRHDGRFGFGGRGLAQPGHHYALADDMMAYKAALRVMPTAAGLGMIPGSS